MQVSNGNFSGWVVAAPGGLSGGGPPGEDGAPPEWGCVGGEPLSAEEGPPPEWGCGGEPLSAEEGAPPEWGCEGGSPPWLRSLFLGSRSSSCVVTALCWCFWS